MVSASASSTNLETAKSFITRLDVEKQYTNAAELLAVDFSFVSPKYNCKSRDQWIETFPEFHKNAPTFEEPVLQEDGTVTRAGVVKFGFLNFSLLETFDFDDEGNIQSITAKRA